MKSAPIFAEWRAQAEACLLAQYCIDLNDAGLDDDRLLKEYALATDPAEFIDHVARKFNLTSRYDVRIP
jgi:hypothetical protein